MIRRAGGSSRDACTRPIRGRRASARLGRSGRRQRQCARQADHRLSEAGVVRQAGPWQRPALSVSMGRGCPLRRVAELRRRWPAGIVGPPNYGYIGRSLLGLRRLRWVMQARAPRRRRLLFSSTHPIRPMRQLVSDTPAAASLGGILASTAGDRVSL